MRELLAQSEARLEARFGDRERKELASAVDAIATSHASAPAVPTPAAIHNRPSTFDRVAAALDDGGGGLAAVRRRPTTPAPRDRTLDDDDDDEDDTGGIDARRGDEVEREHARRVAAAATAVNDLDRPQAAVAFAKVRRDYGSFTAWMARRTTYTSSRNRHELRCLCTALDHLLAEVPTSQPGIEVLVRRVNALDSIESGKGWSVARAIEAEADDSLLPRSVLRSALKEAALADKLEAAGKAKDKGKPAWPAAGGSGSGPARGGRGGRGRGGGRGGGGDSESKRGGPPAAGGRGGAAPSS